MPDGAGFSLLLMVAGYVMRAACPWRLLRSDFPPWSTTYRWFAKFRNEGRFEEINHALIMLDRERIGSEAFPTAAIIDSQSVKTTEAGGSRGMMLERRSKDASATCSLTPTGWPRARTTSGEHPGPRRRRTTDAGFAPHLPVHSARLC